MRFAAAIATVAVLIAGACGKHREHASARAREVVPITITTSFPGASPTVISDAITTPIERQIGEVAGLNGLHSRSTEGRSVVIAEFPAGTDVDVASQAVQKALAAASTLLPRDLPAPPTYTRGSRTGAVLRLTLASKTLPLVELARPANDIVAHKLAQVSGVGDVEVCGPVTETRITIDLAALAASGKTIDDVRAAIAGASLTPAAVGAAPLDHSADPAADYHEIPIVRDTARVEVGASEPSCVALATGMARVVAVTVTPQVGTDPLEVRERLEALMPELVGALPVDVHLDTWPRTRPLAYEIMLDPNTTPARRIDKLERALTELHLSTTSVVQFGAPGREPDVADLRIVPPKDHAQDLAGDVIAVFERHNFTVRGDHDHIVGFSGPDPGLLRKQAYAFVTAIARMKDVRLVEELGVEDRPQNALKIDRDRAATLRITNSDIDTTLRVLAPRGMWVSTTFTQLGQSPVMLAVTGELPGILDQVMVRSTTGSLVPLSAVVSVTETREPDVIFHEGQFPWVGVRVAGPVDALDNVLAKLPVPADIKRQVRDPD
jgi:multidrug efflux pump subunit AcrB